MFAGQIERFGQAKGQADTRATRFIAGRSGAVGGRDKGLPDQTRCAPRPCALRLRAEALASRSWPGVTEDEMRKRLTALRLEHRDLDAAIDALTLAGANDQLQIARLKKRKLRLKDQISLIEDHLIPDIIA
jgi:hypothetical protein